MVRCLSYQRASGVPLVAARSPAAVSVRLATTGAIALASRTATVLTTDASTLTLDGSAVVDGDRVMVKDTPFGGFSGDRGIFTVSGVGAVVLLTRASDFDTWIEIPGALVAVEIGAANADTVWIAKAAPAGTLGTTPITFFPVAGATAAAAPAPLPLVASFF